MVSELEQEFIDLVNFWDAWSKWASQKPSLKHPIQYIKWYFSEPKFKTRKENNK